MTKRMRQKVNFRYLTKRNTNKKHYKLKIY